MNDSNWSVYADSFMPIETCCIASPVDMMTVFNRTLSCSTKYYTTDANPTITVTSNDPSAAIVTNIIYANGELTFDINSLTTECNAMFTLHISASDGEYTNLSRTNIYC